ncbi:MAG: L,D-transpeptidase [Gemmobacter sp.]
MTFFTLGACTTEGPAALGLAPAPQIDPPETIYRSAMDGPHPIAAVPLEKLPETWRRQTVAYAGGEAPGTVIIHPGEKLLYFVTGPKTAIRYGISVGRAGFEWAGEAVVTQTRPWPTWTPPPEMIERDPKLAKWEKGQPGGPTNPLGARAIYLTTNGRDYGYRIHGTPDWWSIGRNASSGCIRMINQDVLDLSQRVQPGAKVIVLKADGTRATRLIVPPPAPPKKPKPVEAVAPVEDPAILPAVARVTDPAASLPASPAAPPLATDSTPPAVTTPATTTPPTVAPVATLPPTPALPILPPAGTPAPATP